MPKGREKSGRFRKIFVKTPGKTTVHLRERKPSRSICSQCKKPLQGVPRDRPAKVGKLAKTQRRPERPYGGVLCSACTRKVFRAQARGEEQ